MHRAYFIFLLLISNILFAQVVEETYSEEAIADEYPTVYGDTLIYNKTRNFNTQRNFDGDLKNKYSGSDFEYIDKLKKKEPKLEKEADESDAQLLALFVGFMTNIFPYLLGVLVVFIILRSFIDTNSSFWKFGKSSKKKKEKLIYVDDENIDENDFEALLKVAIKNKEYRLATRYYYLALLKRLSQKELISYHRDKTNTQYLFELKNEQMRSKFSYLAYIYDYVWYGEFPIDELKFNSIESNYKSFLKNIG